MRIAHHDPREIEAARRVAATAETPMQLRQSQAILIPALTGASLDVTAAILGLSRNRVCVLRRQFRAAGGQIIDATERRGGRRRELMSVEEEKRFLLPWLAEVRNGRDLVASCLRAAYERAVGRKVPKSTIYRLLARHGWRKEGASAPIS